MKGVVEVERVGELDMRQREDVRKEMNKSGEVPHATLEKAKHALLEAIDASGEEARRTAIREATQAAGEGR